MAKASPRTRLFHEAVFEEIRARAGGSKLRLAFDRTKHSIRTLGATSVIAVLASAAALSFEPGREAFAGALVGLIEASLNEYLVHIGVGHAPKSAVKMFRKLGPTGDFLEEITLAHKLHHAIVAETYNASNLTSEQRVRAEKMLANLVETLMLDRFKEKYPDQTEEIILASAEFLQAKANLIATIRKGDFGVAGTPKGVAGMLIAALPYYLLNQAIYMATGSDVFLVSADFWLTFMVIQSLYSHAHLHDKPSGERRSLGTRFQQWYVNSTPLGLLAQRLHFTHHELPYSFERTKNGDIMAGSLWDRLKFDLRRPTVRDLLRMHAQGFLPE